MELVKVSVFLLNISCALCADDIWQWNMMPDDMVKVNESEPGNLGICYGSSTKWSTYPYAAALRYQSGSACCSGSIVSLNPGILLTAAHCSGCRGSVRIGCDNPNHCNGHSYSISNFVQNPNYGRGTSLSNDIAIVRLKSPITTVGAKAQTIPKVESTSGKVRVVGYGITESGSIPSQLQTTTMSIIERTECQSVMASALGAGTYVDNSMICIEGGRLGQENVPATCSGDSGGPSSVGNSQYGVTSWGLQGSGTGCNSCDCCTGFPSVLANVAHFYDWINGYLEDWEVAYQRDRSHVNVTKH